jgi:hypothetical protein
LFDRRTVFRQVGWHDWLVNQELYLGCEVYFRFEKLFVLQHLFRFLLHLVSVLNLRQRVLVCDRLWFMLVLMTEHSVVTRQLAVFVKIEVRNVPCVPLVFFNQAVYDVAT